MRLLKLTIILIFTASLWAMLYLTNHHPIFPFYSDKMRTPLFTGFLTLGGFLFSLKTFILVKLKEDLYDLPAYKKRLLERKKLNPDLTLYGPLTRLGNFLIYCVLFSLITAVMQFSLGFLESDFAASICISLSITTIAVIFIAWWQIRVSMNEWFSILKDSEKEDTAQ